MSLLKMALEGLALQKRAVIIKGNPQYLDHPKVKPLANRFYSDIQKRLETRGYSVEYNAGKEYTTPDKSAAVWIAHSRGIDRLQYAPSSVRCVALETNEPNDGMSAEHYQLSDADKQTLNRL